MDLIIVESPSKAKTISKYLKGKYRVDASGGHIRDLPQKKLGVSVAQNFEPQYVTSPGKEETIKRLTEEAKRAGKVYLATDPDREGEAISWHLQTVLGLDADKENRIEFNEISPKAVERPSSTPARSTIISWTPNRRAACSTGSWAINSPHFSTTRSRTGSRRAECNRSPSASSWTGSGR